MSRPVLAEKPWNYLNPGFWNTDICAENKQTNNNSNSDCLMTAIR